MFTSLICIALLAAACSHPAGAAVSTARSAVAATPAAPGMSTQPPPLDSSSTDLEEDDYVPYNRSRHDEFDFKLLKSVLAGKDATNVIVSPFTVKLMLSILAEAAGKDTATQRELANVLPGVSSQFQMRELYSRVLQSLQEPNSAYDFKIATKIYLNTAIRPRQRFASVIETYYFTRIEQLDFSSPALASASINRWIADTTQNRINDLVQANDVESAAMLLLNAVYFNGLWRRPFHANETVDAPFFVAGATSAAALKTPFMQQTATYFFLDSKPLGAKLVRLPYKGRRFSMTLVLPNPEVSVDELLRRLDSEAMRRAQYYMDEVEVRMQVPKFRFAHTAPLVPVLQELGIRSIFGAEASLPLLARGADANGQLQVSKMLQKAGVEVTEKGSTAYAATEVVLTNKFGGDTTQEFVANRPFVFVIEDETSGTLLFAGKVANPAEFA